MGGIDLSWNQAAKALSGCDCTVYRLTPSKHRAVGWIEIGLGFPVEIFVSPLLSEDKQLATFLHEIAHARTCSPPPIRNEDWAEAVADRVSDMWLEWLGKQWGTENLTIPEKVMCLAGENWTSQISTIVEYELTKSAEREMGRA